jgi:hypothetical protein
VDRTAAEGGELYAWTEQQRMVGSCVDRTAAKGGELYAWTEQQRREESSMRGQNNSGGRGVLCFDRTPVEGEEFYALTELQRREGSFFNFNIAAAEGRSSLREQNSSGGRGFY